MLYFLHSYSTFFIPKNQRYTHTTFDIVACHCYYMRRNKLLATKIHFEISVFYLHKEECTMASNYTRYDSQLGILIIMIKIYMHFECKKKKLPYGNQGDANEDFGKHDPECNASMHNEH